MTDGGGAAQLQRERGGKRCSLCTKPFTHTFDCDHGFCEDCYSTICHEEGSEMRCAFCWNYEDEIELGQPPAADLQQAITRNSPKKLAYRKGSSPPQLTIQVLPTFHHLCEGNSALLKRLALFKMLRPKEPNNILIYGPPRCGKTMALKGFKSVFTFNPNPEDVKDFKSYEGLLGDPCSGDALEDLEIAGYQEQWCIVYMTFAEVKGPYEEGNSKCRMVKSLMNALQATFESCKTYVTKASLESHEWEEFESIRQKKCDNTADLIKALQNLCGWIKKSNRGKKVALLVDEMDTPLNQILFKSSIDETAAEEISQFIGDVLQSSFKENENIDKGIAFGVLPVRYAGLSNESFNFSDCVNSPYSAGFHISPAEYVELCDYHQLNDEARRTGFVYLNGYRSQPEVKRSHYYLSLLPTLEYIKKMKSSDEQNTTRIVPVLQDRNLSILEGLFGQYSFARKIQKLVDGSEVTVSRKEGPYAFEMKDLVKLRELGRSDTVVTEEQSGLAILYLLHNGLLTVKRVTDSDYMVMVPNEAVRVFLRHKLHTIFKRPHIAMDKAAQCLYDVFATENPPEIREDPKELNEALAEAWKECGNSRLIRGDEEENTTLRDVQETGFYADLLAAARPLFEQLKNEVPVVKLVGESRGRFNIGGYADKRCIVLEAGVVKHPGYSEDTGKGKKNEKTNQGLDYVPCVESRMSDQIIQTVVVAFAVVVYKEQNSEKQNCRVSSRVLFGERGTLPKPLVVQEEKTVTVGKGAKRKQVTKKKTEYAITYPDTAEQQNDAARASEGRRQRALKTPT